MKKFKHILCPYDFSEYAEEAIQYAIKMADSDTEITILCIIELFYYSNLPGGITSFDQDEKGHSKSMLEEFVLKLKKKNPDYNIKYNLKLDNDPVSIILAYQIAEKVDLIVMGSHGRKGLNRILMGSVSESVFRDSKCPVLIIKK